MIDKINKRKSKKISIIIGVIIVIALAAGGVYWYSSINTDNTPQLTQKQKSEAQTSTPKKSSNKLDDDGQVATPPAPAPNNPAASLSISSFSQTNHTVQATATITNASPGGSCYFAFSSEASKPVVQTVNSMTSGSDQSCAFSASEVSFDKVGTWHLKVTYSANGTQVEGSRDVTIQ